MSSTPGLPKSVHMLDRHPYFSARLTFGTRLHNLIAAVREIHASLTTSGATLSLVNAIRAALITGGQIQERLQDLEDKAYNMLVSDPAWQQDAGVNTQIENAGAINAVVDGVYYAALVAANTNYVPTAAWDTAAAEEKSVTLCVNTAGTIHEVVSPAATVGHSVRQRPISGECPVGIVVVPPSFTHGVSLGGACAFIDGFPRRLPIHVPISTAAMAALASSLPETLPDIDV